MNIAVMGYKGGVGKTTISKLMGDSLVNDYKEKTMILNLDFYQTKNVKIYSTDSINVPKNKDIDLDEYKDYDNVILDCGGFSDNKDRVIKMIDKIDKIILPTRKGNLSSLELLNVIKDIPTSKHILIIINDFVKMSDKEKGEMVELLKQIIKEVKVKHKYDLLYFKHYETIASLEKLDTDTKKGYTLDKFFEKIKWMVAYSYIKNEIKNIIQGVKNVR